MKSFCLKFNIILPVLFSFTFVFSNLHSYNFYMNTFCPSYAKEEINNPSNANIIPLPDPYPSYPLPKSSSTKLPPVLSSNQYSFDFKKDLTQFNHGAFNLDEAKLEAVKKATLDMFNLFNDDSNTKYNLRLLHSNLYSILADIRIPRDDNKKNLILGSYISYLQFI